MKFVLPVLASITLAACSHASVETSTVRSSSATYTESYAMATTSSKHVPLTSSECAKSFDSTLSYLEYLMEQKQLRDNAAL